MKSDVHINFDAAPRNSKDPHHLNLPKSSLSNPFFPAMSRFETPPRTREEVCRLHSNSCTNQGGISVRFRACVSGNDLGELVVQRHTLLKEVVPSLRSCLTSRPLFQISLVRGDAFYEEAGFKGGGRGRARTARS